MPPKKDAAKKGPKDTKGGGAKGGKGGESSDKGKTFFIKF